MVIRSFIPSIIVALVICTSGGCAGSDRSEVVVYTSQDQVFSEPILAQFTRETGIMVRAVYDGEAVKTAGLANRLLAEKGFPQCDLFWSNEVMRTRQLAAQGVFRADHPMIEFGLRTRRLVVNTNALGALTPPHSFQELTNQIWKGRVALALPLFGTTAAHFLALRQYWGEPAWKSWCEALLANQPIIVDGNSVVVRTVGRGQATIGMTDSDDVAAGQREGFPVKGLALMPDGLAIPNTVAIVAGAPHPDAAMKLAAFLSGGNVGKQLIAVQALESPASVAGNGAGIKIEWKPLLAEMDSALDWLNRKFMSTR